MKNIAESKGQNPDANQLLTVAAYLKSNSIEQKTFLRDVLKFNEDIKNEKINQLIEENLDMTINPESVRQQLYDKYEREYVEQKRKNTISKGKLFLKFLIGSTIITQIYRGYLYLEYEVDILNPKVSDYLLNRFR